MTYSKKKGMVPVRSDQFGDRVMFAGNLDNNDLSFTLSDVQLQDEGVYNCYVNNPPDRNKGHGVIQLKVVTKRKILILPTEDNCACLLKVSFFLKKRCTHCYTVLFCKSHC